MEIGKTYGDLICLKYLYTVNRSQKVYLMKCTICGREKEMKGYVVKSGTGISHKACGKGLKTKDEIFYSRWQAMRTRTTNENYWAFSEYGGRGINSDEFENFIDFYDLMYESFLVAAEKFGKKNVSLERIDNNKSYSKDNCKWIHIKEQQSNQRKVKMFKAISPSGEVYITRNVTKFCEEHGLNRQTVSDVLNGRSTNHKGWKFTYNIDSVTTIENVA